MHSYHALRGVSHYFLLYVFLLSCILFFFCYVFSSFVLFFFWLSFFFSRLISLFVPVLYLFGYLGSVLCRLYPSPLFLPVFSHPCLYITSPFSYSYYFFYFNPFLSLFLYILVFIFISSFGFDFPFPFYSIFCVSSYWLCYILLTFVLAFPLCLLGLVLDLVRFALGLVPLALVLLPPFSLLRWFTSTRLSRNHVPGSLTCSCRSWKRGGRPRGGGRHGRGGAAEHNNHLYLNTPHLSVCLCSC